MINRKTVLIVSVDREVPVENIHRLREQIIDCLRTIERIER